MRSGKLKPLAGGVKGFERLLEKVSIKQNITSSSTDMGG